MGLQTIQSGSFNIQKSPSGVTENATTARVNFIFYILIAYVK